MCSFICVSHTVPLYKLACVQLEYIPCLLIKYLKIKISILPKQFGNAMIERKTLAFCYHYFIEINWNFEGAVSVLRVASECNST